MPSLLSIVFALQLTLHLINTIGAGAVNDLLWSLYNRLPTSTSTSVAQQVKLRREIVKLQRELGAVSAQDDFAKWAKIRRQLDKAVATHDKLNTSLQTKRSSFDRRITIARTVFVNGSRLFIQYWYMKSAMFWIPKGWLPYYVEWILSWPRAPLGSVSIQMWGIACGSIIGMLSEALVAAFFLLFDRTKSVTQRSAAEQKAQ